MFVMLLMYQMTNKVHSVYRIDIIGKRSVLFQYFQSRGKKIYPNYYCSLYILIN